MKISNLFSNSTALAKYLFIVLAATLDILAIGSFMRINTNPDKGVMYGLYAFLMFIDAALMLICAFGINKQKKQLYQFSVIILALNIILTIFGQFGIVDLLFLLINTFTLYILLAFREKFINLESDSRAS